MVIACVTKLWQGDMVNTVEFAGSSGYRGESGGERFCCNGDDVRLTTSSVPCQYHTLVTYVLDAIGPDGPFARHREWR